MKDDARPKESRRVRIADVSREAGVAPSTVSHVLNRTASISEDVRSRVLEAARRLGYLDRRREMANITALRSLLLAVPPDVLVESDINLFSLGILNSLRRECARRLIRVVPFTSGRTQLNGREITAAAHRENVDGIAVMYDDRPALLRALQGARQAVVLINGENPEMMIDTVTPQNRFAARLGARWLLELGHRHILHVTWRGRTTIARRRDGFLDAFREEGLPSGDDLILELDGYEPRLAEAAFDRDLRGLIGRRGITAIFCAADNLALGTLRSLERQGVRVPQDISVLGFDDIVLGEMSRPALSTIRVPLEDIGVAALDLLDQRLRIGRGESWTARRLELGCNVVKRASVGPPAKR